MIGGYKDLSDGLNVINIDYEPKKMITMIKEKQRLIWFYYYLDYLVDQRFAYPNSRWEAMLHRTRLVINCDQPVISFEDWLIYQNRQDLI